MKNLSVRWRLLLSSALFAGTQGIGMEALVTMVSIFFTDIYHFCQVFLHTEVTFTNFYSPWQNSARPNNFFHAN